MGEGRDSHARHVEFLDIYGVEAARCNVPRNLQGLVRAVAGRKASQREGQPGSAQSVGRCGIQGQRECRGGALASEPMKIQRRGR